MDSCSFPPGLLPALCRRKRETGGHTYEPLSASDIDSIGACKREGGYTHVPYERAQNGMPGVCM